MRYSNLWRSRWGGVRGDDRGWIIESWLNMHGVRLEVVTLVSTTVDKVTEPEVYKFSSRRTSS